MKIARIILIVVLGLFVLIAGTILLQQPPVYPFAKTSLDAYFAESRPDVSVDKAGLIQDVDEIVRATEHMHAEPYRIITRAAFVQKAEEIKEKIKSMPDEDIDALAAFYLLQDLVASIQDGHTTLFPLNWEKNVASVFPLSLTSVENRIFLRKNHGAQEIPERAEILSVNGVSVAQIRADVSRYVPATLPAYRESEFANRFALWIQTYYRFPPPWEIAYRAGGETHTLRLDGIDLAAAPDLPLLGPFVETSRDFQVTELTVDGEVVPVLEVVTLGNQDFEVFRKEIDAFFAKYRTSKHMILDFRRQGGGNGEYGYTILSHLAKKPLKGFVEFAFRASPDHKRINQYFFESAYYDLKIPGFLWKLPLYKLLAQDDPYFVITSGIMDTADDAYYYARWGDEKPYLADESVPRYGGKVFFLTSSETFSAGAGTAALFKSNDLGVTVGRETGGRVHMASDPRPVILPHSNLFYLIPTARYVVSADDPDRGVVPDVPVALTAADFIRGRDADIEQVIALMRGQ